MPFVIGCVQQVDIVWGILWPATDAGETAVQKCPGGVESLGKSKFDHLNQHYICTYMSQVLLQGFVAVITYGMTVY